MNIHYETNNLILRNLQEEDCFELQNYLLVNKEFLEEWSPKVDEDFYDISNLKKIINDDNKSNESKRIKQNY